MNALEVECLGLTVDGKTIIDGLSLTVGRGEVHVLAGKNGTGKSSLAKAIARHPGYTISSGDILLHGESIINKLPDEVARMGFFLSFQDPVAIPGVTVANFIRAAVQAKSDRPIDAVKFYEKLYEKMDMLHIDRKFSARSINDGFSGGEKKRCEMLQVMMLEPTFAIFDEIDSGLDIDAVKIVADAINSIISNEFSAIVITHQTKLLEYIRPNCVHVMDNGKIVASGGNEMLDKLEKFGYSAFSCNSGTDGQE